MAKSKQTRAAQKVVKKAAPAVDNRRARHEFHILESLEAGIALTGTEIKSIRAGGISLNQAYARLRDGEMWLMGMHVPAYKQGSFSNVDPDRPRKLLLHKEQIARLGGRASEKGLTLVPLRLYFRKGKAKVELAVARGKQQFDKRETKKKQEAQREIRRAMTDRNR